MRSSSRSVRAAILSVSLVLAGGLASCNCPCGKPESKPGAVGPNARYFPTGEPATSAILLRQIGPSEVRVGEEYESTIEVVNLTEVDLQNVQVNLENMSNVRLTSADPAWTRTNGEVVWMLSDLPAASTQKIKFHAKASAAGAATNCLSVSYANRLCASTNVVEPMLQVTKTATPEVCGTCSDITLTYAVRNSGTGLAENVQLKDTLPEGLTTRDGRSMVEITVGILGGSVERIFNVPAIASKRGIFSSAAYVTGDAGLSAKSTDATTVVKQPSFAFSCDANNRVFLGRELDYRITVRNVGNCAASDVLVKAPVPAGCAFLAADGAGRLEAGNVLWTIGSLPEGKAATVTMSVKPSNTGSARTTATATANCCAPASTECMTEVEGIPAILLEVVDTIDPVEVGDQTTFVITATNQGSKADSNVKVVATLPAALEFVSGSGATAVSASGTTVTMSPVSTLAAGAKAEWRVVVRAKAKQDARSRWEMTSDQFKAPIIETESTNLYE